MSTAPNMTSPTLVLQVSKNALDTIEEDLDAAGVKEIAFDYFSNMIVNKLDYTNLSKNPVFNLGNDGRVLTLDGIVLKNYSSVIVAKWEVEDTLCLRFADGNIVGVKFSVADF